VEPGAPGRYSPQGKNADSRAARHAPAERIAAASEIAGFGAPAVMGYPRFVTAEAAQNFFGIDKVRWNALRKLNLIPSPVAVIGLYDLKALDRAFDRISGLGSGDDLLTQWEQQTNEVQ
jgi:hypothetical protein